MTLTHLHDAVKKGNALMRYLPAALRQRMALLGVFALIAACLTLFIKIADEVIEGETHKFDETILLFLRNPDDTKDPIGPWWLEVLMSDFTSLGSTAVLIFMVLSVSLYFVLIKRHLQAAVMIGSFAGAQALNSLLKIGFARPRPSIVAHLGEVHTMSFPSGHAMLSAVIYLTLGMLLASTQRQQAVRIYIMSVACAITGLIGVSRMYLGVHYPTDVLAGWSAGLAWSSLSWLLVMVYENRSPPA